MLSLTMTLIGRLLAGRLAWRASVCSKTDAATEALTTAMADSVDILAATGGSASAVAGA